MGDALSTPWTAPRPRNGLVETPRSARDDRSEAAVAYSQTARLQHAGGEKVTASSAYAVDVEACGGMPSATRRVYNGANGAMAPTVHEESVVRVECRHDQHDGQAELQDGRAQRGQDHTGEWCRRERRGCAAGAHVQADALPPRCTQPQLASSVRTTTADSHAVEHARPQRVGMSRSE